MRQLLGERRSLRALDLVEEPEDEVVYLTERNGIYIDLQSLSVHRSRVRVRPARTPPTVCTVLFVEVARQAQEAILEQASPVGMPYRTRSAGSAATPTSPPSTSGSQRLERFRGARLDDPSGAGMTKKEPLVLQREQVPSGRSAASATWAGAQCGVDRRHQEGAHRGRCTQARHPCRRSSSTNCDPDEVDYLIPGNDDAI